MFPQCVLGGATACSAETHVAVRTGVCVTLQMALVSANWAGLDSAVTKVEQNNVVSLGCRQKNDTLMRMSFSIFFNLF